jgi:spermidine/putrescine transport system substrate-binding protein
MTRRQSRPLSPEAAAIVRAHRLSRRAFLGGAGAVGLGKPTPAADRSDVERIVNWANWTEYLDYDEKTKTYPTLEKFEKRTQITATYTEDIEDNDTYYGKISGQLKNGQDTGKDLMVFTDYMAARCIRQGYVQKLDKAVIKNSSNLLDNLKNVDFDPGRQYSLTWQSGYAGLAWNKKAVSDLGLTIKNISDLWNPKLKGRVEVLTEYRDTLGIIMSEQGVDISKPFGTDKFEKSLEVFKTQLDNGQIRSVKGNSYLEDLKNGDAIAVIAWSGDILMANFESEQQEPYEFALPEAGGTLWSDNLLIPVGSPHKKNAEILMNYYYDPVVAAEVAAYVNYICPVKGAREEVTRFDPSLADSPYIFPTDEDLAKVKVFRTLTPQEENDFSAKFQSVLGY